MGRKGQYIRQTTISDCVPLMRLQGYKGVAPFESNLIIDIKLPGMKLNGFGTMESITT